MDSVAQLLKDLLEESKKNRERFAELDEEMARRRAEASNTADAHASKTVPMPFATDSRAPRFDKTPHLFDSFCDAFEARAKAAKLPDAEWKKRIIDYLGDDERALWTLTPSYSDDTKTFAQFKADVRAKYETEIDTKPKYTLAGLLQTINEWKNRGFNTAENVNAFQRAFETRTLSLTKQNIAHAPQELFLSAFPDND